MLKRAAALQGNKAMTSAGVINEHKLTIWVSLQKKNNSNNRKPISTPCLKTLQQPINKRIVYKVYNVFW